MTAYMCLLPILGMTGALLHLSRSSFYFACVLQSYAVRMCVAKENPMDITYLFTFLNFSSSEHHRRNMRGKGIKGNDYLHGM